MDLSSDSCESRSVRSSAICALGGFRLRRTTPPHTGGCRMQLLIAFEGCSPMCCWKGRYDGQAAVSTVLADLCGHCGLSPKTTKLRHADQLLQCQVLQQVCKHQAKLLELTATFKVTVAFFIWYSFSLGNVKKHEILASIWQRSVEHRASTAAMDKEDISQYKEELSRFLDLHHTDELPLVVLQHSGYPHATVESTQDLKQNSSCVCPGTLFFLNSVLQLKVDMGIDPEAVFTPWDANFCHICQPCQPRDGELFATLSLCKHMGPIRAAVLLLKLISLAVPRVQPTLA